MPARLNLFSPLPPVRSEIGNHTLVVARALLERAEVTLWTPQAESPRWSWTCRSSALTRRRWIGRG